MVVSKPSTLIGVSSVYDSYGGGAGDQRVHRPAVCPQLGVGGNTVLFCRDPGADIGTSCLLSPHWHEILIVVPRAFGGSVTIWESWWHFGRQTPLLVPWKDTCVGG